MADAEYIRKQFARLDKDGPHCTLQIRTFKGNFTNWMNLSLEQVEAISQILQGVRPSTPASRWRQEGEEDPHAGRYDCERAELPMGDLSDDELANGAFLNYDAPLNPEGILAGTHSSPIVWMTAVKDRIRWLSRKLEEVEQAQQDLEFLAEYVLGREYGWALPNYEALGKFPLDVAEKYNEG